MVDNWKRYDTDLEIVEEMASCKGWISSEEELSEKFDEEVLPGLLNQYSRDWIESGIDTVMISEEFSNWMDSLCSDGLIHREQVDSYEYVGKYTE